MKCEKMKGKEKNGKEKRKCWGSEVNGGGVAAAVGCTYTLCTSVSFRYSIFFLFGFLFVLSIIQVQGDMEGSIEPFPKESAFLTFRSSNSSIVTPTKTAIMTMQHMLFSECLQLQLKAPYVSGYI